MTSSHLSSYELSSNNSSNTPKSGGIAPEDEGSSLDPPFLWSASLLYYTGLPSPKIKQGQLRSSLSMSDMHKGATPLKGSLSKSPSNDSGTGTVSSVGTRGSSSTFGRLSISSFRKRHSSCGSASTNSSESMGSLREKLEKTGSMKGTGIGGMRPKKRSSIASFISRTGSLGRYRKYEFNGSSSNNSPLQSEVEEKIVGTFASVGQSPTFAPTPGPSPILTSTPVSSSTSSLSASTSKALRESFRVAKSFLPSSKITLPAHSSSKSEDKPKLNNVSQLDTTPEPLPNPDRSNKESTTNQRDFPNKNTKEIKNFRATCSAQVCIEADLDKVNKEAQGFPLSSSGTSFRIPVVKGEGDKSKTKSSIKQKNRKDKDTAKEKQPKKVSLVKTLGRKILQGSSKEKKETTNTTSQTESHLINTANIISADTKKKVELQSRSDGKSAPEMVQFENEPRKLTPKSREKNPGPHSPEKIVVHNSPIAMEAAGIRDEVALEIKSGDDVHITEESKEEPQQPDGVQGLESKYKEDSPQNCNIPSTLNAGHNNDSSSIDETAQIIKDIILTNISPLKLKETEIDAVDSITEEVVEKTEKCPEKITADADTNNEIIEKEEYDFNNKIKNTNELVLQESELGLADEKGIPPSNTTTTETNESLTDSIMKVDTDSQITLVFDENKTIEDDKDKDNVVCNGEISISDDIHIIESDDEEGSYTESFKHLEPFSYDIEPIEEGKRERLYKVLVVGELGTGKTSIIKRYVHQFFSQHYRATIGVDFALKVLRWDPETVVRLQLWDIAGQERFGSMTRVYYKEAVGAFVVFDVTRAATLEAVPKWKADLDTKVVLPDGRPIPTVLLANKSDQPKEGIAANREKMNDFCQQQGFSAWFETSAKDNINIDESANFLVSKILEMDRWSQEPLAPDPEKLDLSANGKHKAGGSGSCSC